MWLIITHKCSILIFFNVGTYISELFPRDILCIIRRLFESVKIKTFVNWSLRLKTAFVRLFCVSFQCTMLSWFALSEGKSSIVIIFDNSFKFLLGSNTRRMVEAKAFKNGRKKRITDISYTVIQIFLLKRCLVNNHGWVVRGFKVIFSFLFVDNSFIPVQSINSGGISKSSSFTFIFSIELGHKIFDENQNSGKRITNDNIAIKMSESKKFQEMGIVALISIKFIVYVYYL